MPLPKPENSLLKSQSGLKLSDQSRVAFDKTMHMNMATSAQPCTILRLYIVPMVPVIHFMVFLAQGANIRFRRFIIWNIRLVIHMPIIADKMKSSISSSLGILIKSDSIRHLGTIVWWFGNKAQFHVLGDTLTCFFASYVCGSWRDRVSSRLMVKDCPVRMRTKTFPLNIAGIMQYQFYATFKTKFIRQSKHLSSHVFIITDLLGLGNGTKEVQYACSHSKA